MRFVTSGTTRLIGDADDLEAIASLRVDKVLVLHLQGLDSSGESCAERKKRRLKLYPALAGCHRCAEVDDG